MAEDEKSLLFVTAFKPSYIRTRHNNLRCFPSCSRIHKDNSFCGRSIEIKVTSKMIPDPKTCLVFGKFRSTLKPSGLRKNDVFPKDLMQDGRDSNHCNNMMIAEYTREYDGYYRFVFTPPKKWRYIAKVREQEQHILMIGIVIDNIILSTRDSTSFQVIPIWKAEQEESLARLSKQYINRVAITATENGNDSDEGPEDNDEESKEEEEAQHQKQELPSPIITPKRSKLVLSDDLNWKTSGSPPQHFSNNLFPNFGHYGMYHLQNTGINSSQILLTANNVPFMSPSSLLQQQQHFRGTTTIPSCYSSQLLPLQLPNHHTNSPILGGYCSPFFMPAAPSRGLFQSDGAFSMTKNSEEDIRLSTNNHMYRTHSSSSSSASNKSIT